MIIHLNKSQNRQQQSEGLNHDHSKLYISQTAHDPPKKYLIVDSIAKILKYLLNIYIHKMESTSYNQIEKAIN